VGGDWKRVSCHGSRIIYSCGRVSGRTISLPRFNGLRCRTNADICKRQTAFLFFQGILCDTPKKLRGKKFDHNATLTVEK